MKSSDETLKIMRKYFNQLTSKNIKDIVCLEDNDEELNLESNENVNLFIKWLNMHVEDIVENEFQHVVNYEKQGKD